MSEIVRFKTWYFLGIPVWTKRWSLTEKELRAEAAILRDEFLSGDFKDKLVAEITGLVMDELGRAMGEK